MNDMNRFWSELKQNNWLVHPLINVNIELPLYNPAKVFVVFVDP